MAEDRLRALLSAPEPERVWTLGTDGHRLRVEEHGDVDAPPLVYLHGLLLSSRMNRTVARELAARGQRVVLLDLLGHGASDKPERAHPYRFDTYPSQVAALLDALGSDDVVLGGVSLGAQVALWTGVQLPHRLAGLVLEMPVGERGTPFANLVFIPPMLAAGWAPGPWRAVGGVARRLPGTRTWLDGAVDAAAQPPGVVSSVVHGLLVGPMMPPLSDRRGMDVPSLVVGHTGDPLHPGRDADALARALPRGRLVRTRLPARFDAARFATDVAAFADEARRLPRARPREGGRGPGGGPVAE